MNGPATSNPSSNGAPSLIDTASVHVSMMTASTHRYPAAKRNKAAIAVTPFGRGMKTRLMHLLTQITNVQRTQK